MKDIVFMIQQLDNENGYYVGRTIFLLRNNEKFLKGCEKIYSDKNVAGTHTTGRRVLYV